MTAKEKIYKWIEENREEVTGLLQKLIQILISTHSVNVIQTKSCHGILLMQE